MSEMMESMYSREEKLSRILKASAEILQSMPEGKIRISSHKGIARYYHVVDEEDSNSGQYIRKSDMTLIRQLAQKGYLSKIVASAESEMTVIRRMIKSYPKVVPETVYYDLCPERKELVAPLFLNDTDYVEWWMSETYRSNPIEPEEKCYETKRGDLVRSKSEAMIADAYFDLGIPYKYEYPIDVGNGVTRFADFAVLDIRSRKVYYHEHLGLLDRPDYLKKNMKKLKDYRAIGIFTSKNLILTMETEDHPLNMNLFRKNTAELFGKAPAGFPAQSAE